MVRFGFGLALSVVLFSSCKSRDYDSETQSAKRSEKTVRVVITKSPVEKLAFVIGVENGEASCQGGNAKYRVNAKVGDEVLPELLVPPSVTRIELCGMPGSTGYSTKQFRDLKLEANQTVVIHGDIISQAEAIPANRARVVIAAPKVKQLVKVIGIEGTEAACMGGNPKHSAMVTGDTQFPMVFDVPPSVTKIGLCGQAGSTGMDWKHVDVKLTAGNVVVID
jgi:hypothetical protein